MQSFELFLKLFVELDAATGTLDKLAALKRYFVSASDRDLAWFCALMLSKVRTPKLSSRKLIDAFVSTGIFEEKEVLLTVMHVGDAAEAIATLSSDWLPHTGEGAPEYQVLSLAQWMEVHVPLLSTLPDEERNDYLVGLWKNLAASEIYVLHSLLIGSFRVGVSRGILLRALSESLSLPLPEVTHRLSGSVSIRDDFRAWLSSAGDGESVMRPYPFMLAPALERLSDLDPQELEQGDWAAEPKWDGIRAQILRRESGFMIWSRGEEELTDRFPELNEAIQALPPGTVLDCEILAYENERPLAFNKLSTRIARKKVSPKLMGEVPVVAMVYDLLEVQGIDLREKPMRERRTLLEELLATVSCNDSSTRMILSPQSLVHDPQALTTLQTSWHEKGAEGLMLKHRDSSYSDGRKRGPWWKWKVDPMHLDAVLVYAQSGSGRRSNLFTDYSFALWNNGELVTFAKAYSGLKNDEIEELDRWIRSHTLEKFGPVRKVEEHWVFEIAFEGIAESKRHKSGIAVRFPRISRWRRDKKIQDADSVESARALIQV